MAFWSSWFAPKCDDCGDKIVDYDPIEYEGKQLCDPCHTKVQEERARRQAEIEARREAEEIARAKFEDRKSFGEDPRYS